MHYFDTDVVFHFLVLQEESKHEHARQLILDAIRKRTFVISTLVIQEVGYAMARFELSSEEITSKLSFLSHINTVDVQNIVMPRAPELAGIVGFKYINDCVHTAVSESLNVEKLYTYNKADFKRIQKLTDLEIIIL